MLSNGDLFAYKMYILDHAVAPWFLEVTLSQEIVYFLLPQYFPWHPATPPAPKTTQISMMKITVCIIHNNFLDSSINSQYLKKCFAAAGFCIYYKLELSLYVYITSIDSSSSTTEEALQWTILCCFGCKTTRGTTSMSYLL